MKKVSRLQIAPVASVADFLREDNLVAFNIGYDGLLYFVFALRPLDYRHATSGGSFAVTKPQQPQNYRVVALDGNRVALDMTVENEPFNIHFVAPLPAGILLACGRSRFKSAADFDKNGRLYSFDGKFERDFLLGDGIQDLQTTARGTIWTSFFDEGVIGNRGWHEPVGASGLVARSEDGEKIYQFSPRGGLDIICCCYALNVAREDEVWCYYYTNFPLVKIQRGEIVAHWGVPVKGADAFAVDKNYALFRGGYQQHDYHLLRLTESGAVEEKRLELRDENGAALKAELTIGQGDALYLLSGADVYRFDVGMAFL